MFFVNNWIKKKRYKQKQKHSQQSITSRFAEAPNARQVFRKKFGDLEG